jgi:hypothetical protein
MSYDYRFRHLIRAGATLRDGFLKAKAAKPKAEAGRSVLKR